MFCGENLGDLFTEPPHASDVSTYRIADMFTSVTDSDVKESILTSFKCVDAQLHIVISTIAFRMGVDCQNVQKVVHYGPSSDVESYIQEFF